MFSGRAIILTCLIILFAVAINLLLEQEEAAQTNLDPAKNDPDLYMRHASITQYTSDGTRQHRIAAERFTHFPLTDITTLLAPNMTLYPATDASLPWDIHAKHGRLLPKALIRDEIVELWDRVLAVQQNEEGEFVHIRTKSLTVYPETDYAETDQKVIIDDNKGRTTAAGMKAYFAEGRFIFFSRPDERVRTTLLPVFPGDTD